jgi:hypothetical protein
MPPTPRAVTNVGEALHENEERKGHRARTELHDARAVIEAAEELTKGPALGQKEWLSRRGWRSEKRPA